MEPVKRHSRTEIINQECWMSVLEDNLKITQINMPGTHDSAACHVAFSFISKTQSLTVSEQLSAGVRYFDFRFEFVGNSFFATHSIARCKTENGLFSPKMTADDVVKYCENFLKKNPTETILFQLKEAVSHMGNEFFDVFFERYIKGNEDFWFVENRIPTLGEVRGKIVLLRVVSADTDRFTNENCGIDFTAYPYIGTYNVDDWKRGEIRTLSGKVYSHLYVQDSYKTEGMHKWGTVTRFLESGLYDYEFNICLTSCTRVFVPRFNAPKINKLIKSYNFIKGILYGIIVSDFIDAEICEKIINSN